MRLEKVEKRGAFVAAPNLVLVAAAPGAQRQQVAALTGVGARLGEDPEQGLTRRRGDVNRVGQRGADRGGAPDVPQRRRRGRARRRLTFRPAQLEHGVRVESEPRGERVHKRGVVLREHAQRIAGFKVETPRAARVKLDVKHPSVGFWVGHELGLGNLREVRLLVREVIRARGWGGRVRAPGVPGEGRGVRQPRHRRATRGQGGDADEVSRGHRSGDCGGDCSGDLRLIGRGSGSGGRDDVRRVLRDTARRVLRERGGSLRRGSQRLPQSILPFLAVLVQSQRLIRLPARVERLRPSLLHGGRERPGHGHERAVVLVAQTQHRVLHTGAADARLFLRHAFEFREERVAVVGRVAVTRRAHHVNDDGAGLEHVLDIHFVHGVAVNVWETFGRGLGGHLLANLCGVSGLRPEQKLNLGRPRSRRSRGRRRRRGGTDGVHGLGKRRPQLFGPRLHRLFEPHRIVRLASLAHPLRSEKVESRVQRLRRLVAVLRRGGLPVQEQVRVPQTQHGVPELTGERPGLALLALTVVKPEARPSRLRRLSVFNRLDDKDGDGRDLVEVASLEVVHGDEPRGEPPGGGFLREVPGDLRGRLAAVQEEEPGVLVLAERSRRGRRAGPLGTVRSLRLDLLRGRCLGLGRGLGGDRRGIRGALLARDGPGLAHPRHERRAARERRGGRRRRAPR